VCTLLISYGWPPCNNNMRKAWCFCASPRGANAFVNVSKSVLLVCLYLCAILDWTKNRGRFWACYCCPYHWKESGTCIIVHGVYVKITFKKNSRESSFENQGLPTASSGSFKQSHHWGWVITFIFCHCNYKLFDINILQYTWMCKLFCLLMYSLTLVALPWYIYIC